VPLTNPEVKVQTVGNVRATILAFLEAMKTESIASEFLPNGRTKEETLDIIRQLYL
jgi:hypothetical protein